MALTATLIHYHFSTLPLSGKNYPCMLASFPNWLQSLKVARPNITMNYKAWYKSKTIRIAFIQAIAGILTAILATNPELKAVGAIALIKSAVDMALRYVSDQPIL